MSATVEIPAALQNFTNNEKNIQLPDGTVQEVFDKLIERHGALRKHIYDENGKIRSFINIYVNEEDIRHANDLATEVKSGDVIHIIPSIAGG